MLHLIIITTKKYCYLCMSEYSVSVESVDFNRRDVVLSAAPRLLGQLDLMADTSPVFVSQPPSLQIKHCLLACDSYFILEQNLSNLSWCFDRHFRISKSSQVLIVLGGISRDGERHLWSDRRPLLSS